MARRSAPPPGPEPRVFHSTDEIDRAIAKLRKRTDDIRSLESRQVMHADAEVESVEHAIIDTIREEFGAGSEQYERHKYFEIDDGPKYMMGFHESEAGFDRRSQEQFRQRISGAIKRLEGLIRWLEEKRGDLAEPEAASRIVFAGRTLNPTISSAAKALYDVQQYALAVFEASKALINLVKQKSGVQQDGVDLMRRVFSRNAPALAFNDLQDQSDKDEQEGMMHLYEGAAMAIRNPRGHRVGVTDSSERALQYLEFLSLLADRLDETKKV